MMLSTCPSCLSQVSHMESISQVSCECGEKFSPFMRPEEWSKDMEDISIGTPKFAESESAFQEIRDFGEGLDSPSPVLSKAIPPPEKSISIPLSVLEESPLSEVKPAATGKSAPFVGDALITTAMQIPGFLIESHFLPISLLCPLVEGVESPMDEAFHKIWEKAVQLGANAIVDLKWKIFPDGTRILMTATPVTCQKQP